MNQPVGDNCPGCGWPSGMRMGPETRFCTNLDCEILMWDPSKTLKELRDNTGTVTITEGRNPGGDA